MADWCPFCRAFRPEFEASESTLPASLAIADVTSEESPLWETFGIEVVPTIALFEDGALVWRRDGRPGQGLGRDDLEALRQAASRRAGTAASGAR